ncbi:hypothetical protein C8Q74DRAFT_1367750 [Fomes fomentarius]|nr:hypothetical protein C8Q74DRAFT_1367750 [Fomes fomentarius]
MQIRPTLDDTLGAAYIGSLLVACFLGLTTLQTYLYFTRYHDSDPTILRLAIAVLWILDVAHMALLAHTVYKYAVTDFGDFLSLTKVTPTILIQIIITGFNDTIVRLVYCSRIWKLSNHNRVICAVVIVVTLATLAFNINGVIECINIVSYFEIHRTKKWTVFVTLAMGSLADVLISVTLCVLLSRKRQRSHARRLESTVRILQMYMINTGITTSVLFIVALALYAIAPTTLIWFVLFCILPKLFSNALLGMLNARKSLREHMGDVVISLRLNSAIEGVCSNGAAGVLSPPEV